MIQFLIFEGNPIKIVFPSAVGLAVHQPRVRPRGTSGNQNSRTLAGAPELEVVKITFVSCTSYLLSAGSPFWRQCL